MMKMRGSGERRLAAIKQLMTKADFPDPVSANTAVWLEVSFSKREKGTKLPSRETKRDKGFLRPRKESKTGRNLTASERKMRMAL